MGIGELKEANEAVGGRGGAYVTELPSVITGREVLEVQAATKLSPSRLGK